MNKSRKKRRKENYYVVTISDNPKALTRAFRLSKGSRYFWEIVISALVVVLIAFVALLNYRNSVLMNRELVYKNTVEELQLMNEQLLIENDKLNDKISILSATVNEKNEVVNAIEEKSVPSGFPISAAADVKEISVEIKNGDESVTCLAIEFTAGNGAYVLAPGNGIVSKIIEKDDDKWEIDVDHGNGYITYYEVPNKPKVKEGDEVARGGPLCELKTDDKTPKMLYRISYSGEFIEPGELLKIDG